MNRYRKSKLVVVSSVLLIFSFSLLFLTSFQGYKVPFLNDSVRQIFSSIDRIASKPSHFFSQQRDYLTEMISAYRENQELKATLANLENSISEMDSLKNENESLRQSLALKDKYSDKQVFSALVSVRTPNTWNQKLILSLGELDGIHTSMLVVANGALIGTISSLESHSSTVKLLTNSDEFSKIPVKISSSSTDIYGILSGYDTDSHSFVVDQLNSDVDIPVGSSVVTSDLAGETPSNIPVGKVSSVKTSTSNLKREIYIQPTANFSNIYAVSVVGQ